MENKISVHNLKKNFGKLEVLKDISIEIREGEVVCMIGPSGSGKSTLVRDIFYRALKRELDECSDRPGEFSSIGGSLRDLRNIEFVDQNPIGKSSRSNPVTYIKAYDEIRKLWATCYSPRRLPTKYHCR